jgi:hypothetical protein
LLLILPASMFMAKLIINYLLFYHLTCLYNNLTACSPPPSRQTQQYSTLHPPPQIAALLDSRSFH